MPEPIGPAVGRTVRRLREAKGLSGLALAQAAGVTQGHVWALEAGQVARPGAAILMALARTLGVTVDDLLREAEGTAHEAPGRGAGGGDRPEAPERG